MNIQTVTQKIQKRFARFAVRSLYVTIRLYGLTRDIITKAENHITQCRHIFARGIAPGKTMSKERKSLQRVFASNADKHSRHEAFRGIRKYIVTNARRKEKRQETEKGKEREQKMQSNNYFKIYEKLPSLNEYVNANRTNKFKGYAFKRKVQGNICGYITVAKNQGTLRPIKKPCEIYMDFTEKTHRRDVDNIQSSQKFILDAMVESKILPNDSPKWVRQIYHMIHYGNDDECIVRILEEK